MKFHKIIGYRLEIRENYMCIGNLKLRLMLCNLLSVCVYTYPRVFIMPTTYQTGLTLSKTSFPNIANTQHFQVTYSC